jgi:hypothetical protein
MKFVFILLLISFSTIAFSQMTFKKLVKIYKMDMDQFEEYAISRGYKFHHFKKDEDLNGISYSKGEGKETKYLTLYDNFYGNGNYVEFQTCVSSELLKIKTEMKKFGYTLYESNFMENRIKYDDYKRGVLKLSIYTKPPNDENNYVIYEISFGKYYKK